MISNRTLGDCVANGFKLIGNCTRQHCGRARYLDMGKLVALFGEDFDAIKGRDEIGRKFVCDCGHVGGELTTEPTSDEPSENPYLRAKGG